LVTQNLDNNNSIACIFPTGEGCMISNIAAERLNTQLSKFYPRKHLSYVFEFRINEDEDQVDFAMAIDQKEDLLFFKSQYEKTTNHAKVVDWLTDCIHLLENNQSIISYWIEADLNGQEDRLIPSLFISPKTNTKKEDYIGFFRVLNFNQLCEKSEELLLECMSALDGAHIEHIGIMHSRSKNKTTRLYIKGLNQKTIIPFLNKINWPGDKQFLTNKLQQLEHISFFTIAIEYNIEWLPTIGIEFHLGNEQKDINKFLLDLEAANLLNSDIESSVLEILKQKKIRGTKLSYNRGLSHFKLNITKKREVVSKVYVQLTPNYTGIFGF